MRDTTVEVRSELCPRVYRPSGFWRIILILLGIAFIAGSGIGLWFSATGEFSAQGSRVLASGLCVLGILCGGYCLLYVFKSRVALFPDRISIENLTGTRELSLHQIRGWRMLPTNPVCLVLQPSDRKIPKAKIGLTFPIDAHFEQWLESLPCLDAEEEAASEEEITSDGRLGKLPAERATALADGRRLATRMSVASTVICGWGIFYPRPYILVIGTLICLPCLGIEILRRSKGLFRVDERRHDAHPSVATLLIFPPLVLALRSVLDYNVFQSAWSFLLYASVGALLAFLAAKFDPTLWARRPIFAIFCAIGLTYGFGAVTEANALLDRSTGTSYSAIVQAKHIDHGKHTSFNLELSPWGPKTKASDLKVGRAIYDPIRCGDTALLTLRRGAFGLNWYYLRAWQRGEDSHSCK